MVYNSENLVFVKMCVKSFKDVMSQFCQVKAWCGSKIHKILLSLCGMPTIENGKHFILFPYCEVDV